MAGLFNSMPAAGMAAQTPGAPPTQVAQTDVIGPIMAKWQGEIQNAMLKQQAQRALQGSVFGLGGSGLSAWGLNGFPLTGTKVGKLFGMTDPAKVNQMGQGVGSPSNYSMGSSSSPGTDLSLLNNGASQVTDLGPGMAGAADFTMPASAADIAGFGGDMALGGAATAGLEGAATDAALTAAAGMSAEDLLPLLLLA